MKQRIYIGGLSWLLWIFTPHFWLFLRHRENVVSRTQMLLPPPYDPQGMELALRGGNARIVDEELKFQPEFSETVEKLKTKVFDSRARIIGTGEMAAYETHDVVSAFAAMDKDFYAGVAHRANEQIHSLSDLTRVLHDTPTNLWGDATKSAVDNLSGHVGEAVVLHHLHDADIPASWSEHGNTPAWDLNIGGHLVNVKTVSDVSALGKHFSEHPDIPAIVPHDAAHLPEDAVHFDYLTGHGLDQLHHALASSHEHLVLVDDRLSGADLHDQVQSAETLATGGHGTFHFHFPIVTLAISGFREFDLLLHDKTNPVSALKNASLDVAGIGVGGAAGAKLGAIVGTFICPGPGTAIGGIIGGIAGAITGRGFTDEIKYAPFRDAVAAYEEKRGELEANVRSSERSAKIQIEAFRSTQQKELEHYCAEGNAKISETYRRMGLWNEYYRVIQAHEAEYLLAPARSQLSSLWQRLVAQYQSHPFWRKYLWPDIETMALQHTIRFLGRVLRQIDKIRRMAAAGQNVDRNEVLLSLGLAGLARQQVEMFLARIADEKRTRDEEFRAYVKYRIDRAYANRLRIEGLLKRKWGEISERVRRALQPSVEAFKGALNEVETEGAKLGVS